MREIAGVIAAASGPKAERLAAQRAFLSKRGDIWKAIQEGRFPGAYGSADGNTFYCCPKCTPKPYECVRSNAFRYIDNATWKTEIEVVRDR